MKSNFSLGRAIALAIGLFIIFIFWGLVFSPGGSGSNVLLGIMLGIACIYFVVVNLGPYLDSYFFHGGSRKRAMAIYEANRSLAEMKGRLQDITSKKRKRKKYSFDALQKMQNSLSVFEESILTVQNNWSDKSKIDEQIAFVQKSLETSQADMKNLLGKSANQHFFSGWDSLLMALIAALALRFFIVEPYQIPSGSMIPTLLVGDHLFVSKLRYGIINPFSKGPSYLIRWSAPKPGDVVIFEAPSYVNSHAGQTWIKRVIAGPGQKVYISNSVVYVDDKPYAHVTPETKVEYLDYFGAGSSGWIFSDNGVWREQVAMETKERISEEIVHDIYMRSLSDRWEFENQWPVDNQRNLPGLTCNDNSCVVHEGYLFVMGDNRGNSSDGRVWGAVPIENIKGKALFIWLSVEGHNNLVELGRFVLPEFRWSRWFTAIK